MVGLKLYTALMFFVLFVLCSSFILAQFSAGFQTLRLQIGGDTATSWGLIGYKLGGIRLRLGGTTFGGPKLTENLIQRFP